MRKAFAILLVAVPLVTGCVKEILSGMYAGQQINFSASTSYSNGPGTKTAYSGQFFGETTQFERIDWVGGDKIRIYSPEASHRYDTDLHYADYHIVASTISDSGRTSSAGIAPEGIPDTGNGLVWGDEPSYSFYALYPSPCTEGALVTMSDNTVSATIPAHQQMQAAEPITDGTGNVMGYRYRPDMRLAYMYAAASASSGGTVDLQFKPLMTAFEFTLDTDADALSIKQICLSTNDADTHLAGQFSAVIASDNTFTLDGTPTGTGNLLFADLPEFDEGGTLTLERGKPIIFTLFALPTNLTGITLTISLADNTTRVLELRYADAPDNFVVFNACRKYRISNIEAPEVVWIYTLEPTGPTVTLPDGTVATVLTRNSESPGTTNAGPFDSYRTSVYSSLVEPVAISSAYEYALADGNGNPVLDANGAIVWTTNVPDAISSLNVSGNLSEKNLRAVLSYNENPIVDTEYSEVLGHAENLKSNGTNGFTAAAPQDLSLYDITNLATPRASGKPTTANCYIVDRAGWYMFPIVYGNAIDYTKSTASGPAGDYYLNGINRYAYDSGVTTTLDYNLNILENCEGGAISSPYVLEDVGLTLNDVEAVIVWQDVESADYSFIGNVSVDEFPSASVYYDPVAGSYKTSMQYIKFEIPLGSINPNTSIPATKRITGIRQGNALVALRKKASVDPEQSIVWSWHIWVTDGYDADRDTRGDGMDPIRLKAESVTGHQSYTPPVESYYMLPVDLGWCDTGSETTFKDRIVYVRARQVIGNADPIVFKVVQKTSPHKGISSGTYYQLERKDPFLPSRGMSYTNKNHYSPAGYAIDDGSAYLARYPGVTSISYAISHPNQFINSYLSWNTPQYDNLWNMAIQHIPGQIFHGEVLVSKTIYDPCPPGYSVPAPLTFLGFVTEENRINGYHIDGRWSELSGINAKDQDGDGILTPNDFLAIKGGEFYTGYNNETVYFGFNGYRQSYYSSVTGLDNSLYDIGYYSSIENAITLNIVPSYHGETKFMFFVMNASSPPATGKAIRAIAEQTTVISPGP